MFGIAEIENDILRYIIGYGVVIVGGLSAIGIIWCIGTFVEMLLGINQPIEVEIRERHKRYDKYRDELWEEYAREEIKNRYGIDEYKDK